MGRKRAYAPLRVYQNNRLVGQLLKQSSGAIQFRYDEGWLTRDRAFPVSLSLPLREDAFHGEVVSAVFDNLLPDSNALRHRIAEKVGAKGTDAYGLLEAIGHDCVGALQFLAGDEPEIDSTKIDGEPVNDAAIEQILNNLAQAPLGLQRDDAFRISVAGAQEKTALLHHNGQWLKPHGTTPTTHIIKTQIGKLPQGINLTNSVENEFYCLKLFDAFNMPVNKAEIKVFGETKSLVIERFDIKWTDDGCLLRLPQEDSCQALSYPPTLKYQSDGGPGIAQILDLLKGSDSPAEDQKLFMKANMLFWLIGATDGHAKNFSVFLGVDGRYALTPFYDILTAQPFLDSGHVEQNQMRLAMSVGTNCHYRFHEIHGRHFVQSGKQVKLPDHIVSDAMTEIRERAKEAFDTVEASLPADFPAEIHNAVKRAFFARLDGLIVPA